MKQQIIQFCKAGLAAVFLFCLTGFFLGIFRLFRSWSILIPIRIPRILLFSFTCSQTRKSKRDNNIS